MNHHKQGLFLQCNKYNGEQFKGESYQCSHKRKRPQINKIQLLEFLINVVTKICLS